MYYSIVNVLNKAAIVSMFLYVGKIISNFVGLKNKQHERVLQWTRINFRRLQGNPSKVPFLLNARHTRPVIVKL